MAKEVDPKTVMTFLNQLFTLFDKICDVHKVQKVETAGETHIPPVIISFRCESACMEQLYI